MTGALNPHAPIPEAVPVDAWQHDHAHGPGPWLYHEETMSAEAFSALPVGEALARALVPLAVTVRAISATAHDPDVVVRVWYR